MWSVEIGVLGDEDAIEDLRKEINSSPIKCKAKKYSKNIEAGKTWKIHHQIPKTRIQTNLVVFWCKNNALIFNEPRFMQDPAKQ